MGRNNRQNRKEKKKAGKNRKSPAGSGSSIKDLEQEQRDARATMISFKGLTDDSAPTELLYSLFRRIGNHQQSSVWLANKNLFELYAFSRKPAALTEGDLKQTCRSFGRNLEEGYSDLVRALQRYAKVDDWKNPNNSLLQRLKCDPYHSLSELDLPAIIHFYLSGWLEMETQPVQYCLRYLANWCARETASKPLDFNALLLAKKALATPAKLKALDNCLKRLDELGQKLSDQPLFVRFIEPSLRALIQRKFRAVDAAKLLKYPAITRMCSQDALARPSSAGPLQALSKVTMAQLDGEIIEEMKVSRPGGELTYSRHVGSLVLQWRFWTLARQQSGGGHPTLKQHEQQAFLNLWATLSRGVPEAHKMFAAKVKNLCISFVFDCVSKSPHSKPISVILDALAEHSPHIDWLTWLQIAYSQPGKAQLYLDRLPERPKAMTFDLFYALYQVHGLKNRSEFLSRHYEALPAETQREILVPWFRRASSLARQSDSLNAFVSSTFGTLLQIEKFPVSELSGEAELEGELVLWSLAFAFDRQIKITSLSPERLKSFLSTLLRLDSPAFWNRFGEGMILELFPQILRAVSAQKGCLDELLMVIKCYSSLPFLHRLDQLLGDFEGSGQLRPEWRPLLDFLAQSRKPQKGRGRSPKKSAKDSNQMGNYLDRLLPF